MNRGDVVLVAGGGDFAGKPRPAIVVQAQEFCDLHPSFTLVPITSTVRAAVPFRIAIRPDAENGLRVICDAEVDKVQSVRRDRIGRRIGRTDVLTMLHIDNALRLWLAL